MMTEEQRIEWLLELQDHSEQLTDEQLQQIHDDDEIRQLVQQLGFAKRAFLHDEHKNDSPNVDDEWEKFAVRHTEELDALDEGGAKPRFPTYLFTHKIAASFVGVLLASGIAFAAIQVVRNVNTPKPQIASTEQATGIKPVTSLPADTVKTDTIAAAPYIFNNVPLDSMLTVIAAVHGVGVEFENDAARQLRFHFVWKREDSLSRVVEKLNTFEAVTIGMEGEKLLVR
jgi:hypothetical protein